MKSPPGMQMCTLNSALLALIITWLLFLTVQQRPPAAGQLLAERAVDRRPRDARRADRGRRRGALVGDDRQSWRFPPSATFLEGLRGCETLDCVRDAHALPHGDARYNFPHFMIAGYSKSATTSLYSYLTRHPDIIKPAVKESNFPHRQLPDTGLPAGLQARVDAGVPERHAHLELLDVEGEGAAGVV